MPVAVKAVVLDAVAHLAGLENPPLVKPPANKIIEDFLFAGSVES